MLTKLTPIARLASQQARFQGIRCLADHAPANFKSEVDLAREHKSSMDFHPAPEGNWQEYYNQRNSKWNMMLGASSVLLVGTLFAMYQAGCFYLHERPPKN